MKILIIRLSSIGDCVLSSPVLEALRERYPDAHITWAVQSKSAPVVQGLPGLDEVLLWNNRSHEHSLLAALRKTWRERFDIALDLHGLDKAALFALASRARRRISGTSARFLANRMSNEKVIEDEFMHAREFYLRRASFLDIAPDAAQRFFPRVPVTDSHREGARKFLQERGVGDEHRVLGLNLGASETEKQWPPERFAQLASTLLEEESDLRVAVFGAPADKWLWKRFNAEFERLTHHNEKSAARVVNAVGGLSLLEVAAVAEKSAAFISADTGPMHIAAAAGAPLLALFGPSDTRLTAPVHNPGNPPVKILDARDLAGSWPASMNLHSVARVLEEVRSLLRYKATPSENVAGDESSAVLRRNGTMPDLQQGAAQQDAASERSPIESEARGTFQATPKQAQL
jgi:ADP-heptose:LPS heptosyltransferase